MVTIGEKITKEIRIEDVGKLKKLIGCKVEVNKTERSAKFTQAVMIQSFWDEFGAGQKT